MEVFDSATVIGFEVVIRFEVALYARREIALVARAEVVFGDGVEVRSETVNVGVPDVIAIVDLGAGVYI